MSRTPEEREAARLERERRRAGRKGARPPASSPPQAAAPPAPAPAAPAPAAPQPTAPGPATERSAAPAPTGIQLAEPGHDFESESGEHWDDEPAGREPTEPDGSSGETEAPAGTRRISGLDRAQNRDGAPPRRRRPHRPGRGGGPHRRSWRGRAVAFVAIGLGIVLVWFLVSLFQPFHGAGGAPVRVTIPPRLTSSQVGDLLAREGVISSSFFFELRATIAGERGSLRSGTYVLRRDMSYGAVLTRLTTPPPAARVTELTVIEGETRAELSHLLHRQGIRGDYLRETRRVRGFDPARYGAPGSIPSLEGFLFPSTYQLREPITVSALVADQLRTFSSEIRGVNLAAARHVHLTAYDVLKIASLVQGEARTAGDRARIASVIYNRLRARMPLQIDATVRYATGNYTRPITLSQLHSSSPWNTYTHPGLPLTPIDSPGLAAIQAAAHPAHTNYLFFVVKPCGNGAHAFASSYAQFQALEARYNQARLQRGGRSPEFCR